MSGPQICYDFEWKGWWENKNMADIPSLQVYGAGWTLVQKRVLFLMSAAALLIHQKSFLCIILTFLTKLL